MGSKARSASSKKTAKIALLKASHAGAPLGLSKKSGGKRGRSPSASSASFSASGGLSPAAVKAARAAAAANLRMIREARLKIISKRNRNKSVGPPKPNYVTGDNVKGLWGIYLRFLHQRPILAVICTSLLLWAIGDALSQYIEHKLRAKGVDAAVTEVEALVDKVESAAAASDDGSGGSKKQQIGAFKWPRFFGAIFDGSMIAGVGGYYWYMALDKFVIGTCLLKRGTLSFVSTKMALEFLVWHPLNLITFWMVVGLAEGDGFFDILGQFRDDFFPTLAGEYALWGPLDIVNFAIVPVHLQVILCNVGSLVESVFLSYVRSQGFPGFPEPARDSLEDRGMPISVVDVLRRTDVSFEKALTDGAKRFRELDTDEKGYIVAEDIERFMEEDNLAEDGTWRTSERLLPGIPSRRATFSAAELLMKHAQKKGQVTRREYLRFVGEMQHASYRESRLAEVAFSLFDPTERHLMSGASLIELAELMHDTPEGRHTLSLMMPALEALRAKELTVDEKKSNAKSEEHSLTFHSSSSKNWPGGFRPCSTCSGTGGTCVLRGSG